jgi:UDPglucose 6-dehydrogenase
MKVSVFGLGKLGAPLAALLASKGHAVVGCDIDPHPVELMARGIAPVIEPGLSDLLQRTVGGLTTTTDVATAVRESSLSFVVVPTPSDESGGFSSRYVIEAATAIGEVLRQKTDYHLVVLTSTVMPGTTATEFIPALERAACMACGTRFGVCYNPEFIALGSVLHDMLNPDFVLIGESDGDAGEQLQTFYQTFCDNHPPVARMTLQNAEIAKLALNTFVTMKITFANMLADLCEHFPSGDVDTVTTAIGLDQRVGSKYLKGGVGYGGPCFPRDVVAFTKLAQTCGVDARVAEATDLMNCHRIDALADKVLQCSGHGTRVAVLGLTYKPHTPVIERSAGIALAAEITKRGRRVVVYDPVALDAARSALGDSVSYASTLHDALAAADVIVITTPWPEFSRLPVGSLKAGGSRKVIVDCWRLTTAEKLLDVADVVYVGRAAQAVGSGASARLLFRDAWCDSNHAVGEQKA